MVLPSGMTVVDVSVIHPAASSYVQAARTVGGAAAVRDAAKRVRYESIGPNWPLQRLYLRFNIGGNIRENK